MVWVKSHTYTEKNVWKIGLSALQLTQWALLFDQHLFSPYLGVKVGNWFWLRKQTFLVQYQSDMSTLAQNHSGGSVSVIGFRLGRALFLSIQISVSASISDPASPSALSAMNTLTPTTPPHYPTGSQWRANKHSFGLMSFTLFHRTQCVSHFMWEIVITVTIWIWFIDFILLPSVGFHLRERFVNSWIW